MSARVLLLMAGLVLFLGIVLAVSWKKQPPEIPGDEVHVQSYGQPDVCLSCHGPGGDLPRSPNHPFGNVCGNCHFQAGEVRQ